MKRKIMKVSTQKGIQKVKVFLTKEGEDFLNSLTHEDVKGNGVKKSIARS